MVCTLLRLPPGLYVFLYTTHMYAHDHISDVHCVPAVPLLLISIVAVCTGCSLVSGCWYSLLGFLYIAYTWSFIRTYMTSIHPRPSPSHDHYNLSYNLCSGALWHVLNVCHDLSLGRHSFNLYQLFKNTSPTYRFESERTISVHASFNVSSSANPVHEVNSTVPTAYSMHMYACTILHALLVALT